MKTLVPDLLLGGTREIDAKYVVYVGPAAQAWYFETYDAALWCATDTGSLIGVLDD